MKKAVLAALLALAFSANASDNRVLIEPKAGVSVVELDNYLNTQSAQRLFKIKNTNFYAVKVSPNDENNAVQRFKNSPLIKNAEVDKRIPPDLLTNDPQVDSQWHLTNINAFTAWNTTLGETIKIAILDTGVNINHEDLSNSVVSGWNTVSNNSIDVTDIYGHGTAVAGSAAAIANNAIGIAGVAGRALIMPIRITNSTDGWAYYSDMAEGITWAADNGAKVVNLSYNGSGSSVIASAASYMNTKGGVVVTSAGNDGADLGYLANSSLFVAGATASNNTRASWSNFGQNVDVVAPGVSILTTASTGGYRTASGTSFSSPITAGVVALVMATAPSLTAAQVMDVVTSTTVDLGTVGYDIYYGHGLVNAENAVAKALTVPADRETPIVSISSAYSGTVGGTITIDAVATDNVKVSKVELMINNTLFATDNTSPWTFSINTKNYSNDTKLLINAVAYDEAGNFSASNTLEFIVFNQTVKKGRGKPPK